MWLALDTSGSHTSIALGIRESSGQIVFTECNLPPQASAIGSHSSSLLLLVQQALRKFSHSIEQLEAIIVGEGPGSFTGLRIGFAFAKGLAIARGVPLYQGSSLAAVAWEMREKAASILVLDDARRTEYFAAAFKIESQAGKFCLTQVLDSQILSRPYVDAWLGDHSEAVVASANAEVVSQFPASLLARHLGVALGEQASSACGSDKTTVPPHDKPIFLKTAKASPFYLREVAAKTIEERQKSVVDLLTT